MTTEHRELSKLREENRLLRQAIAAGMAHLDKAVGQLRKVLDDEAIIAATPIEADFAMQIADDAIEEAIASFDQINNDHSAKAMPVKGGPTSHQGQFLAYIHEYMKLNHGAAPTHAELRRFFNLTPPSINSMLKRLAEQGFIRRIPRKARAIELTIDPDLIPPLEQPFT